MAEAGYPDVVASAWFGLVAPAKTPKNAIAQTSEALKAALSVPEIRAKLVAQGIEPSSICGAEFAAHLQREYQNYARAIKNANIKVE